MSVDTVIQVLHGATSQDVNIVKQAEEQLKSWEVNQGFYASLLDIAFSKNIDINVRWMAVLYLKNGILKYWRQTGKVYLSEDEKALIREKLLCCFDEETLQLATQNAVIIGKIARIDIRRWPQVIMKTLEVIKSDKELLRNRALMVLNQIVKELASKRLITDRKVFHEISQNIFSFLGELNEQYLIKLTSLHSSIQIKATLQMSILLVKILRRLVVYGAIGYSADSIQVEYIKTCFQYLHSLLLIKDNPAFGQCTDQIEKLIVLFLKTATEFQEHHSCSYLPLLENSIVFCLEQITQATNKVTFKPLVIYSGNLLLSIMRSYRKPASKDKQLDEITKNAIEIKDKILTKDCMHNLCHHIFMKYFPLTDEELDEFHSAPEDFMNVEVGESHKFLLRPCIETLFVGFFYEYKSYVIPYLMDCVKKVNTVDLSHLNESDLMYVTSIYKAIGLSSYELFGDLDFDQMFNTRLINIMQTNAPNFTVLHQHVVWMIGEWINVKFSKQNRVLLYEMIKHILNAHDSHLVLKLTCCKCLRSAIDDFDFVKEDFTPFLNDTFIGLCQLLVAVELCDTKMVVLNVISVMVERVGNELKTTTDLLVQYLPNLWELSEAHNLLRGAAINVLNHLVKGLGCTSEKTQLITYPIIHFSTAVDQPAHVYLLEDGLELWLTVIRFTSAMNGNLLQLYRNIHVLLERASETLDTCLSITKAYLLTDATSFLKEYGPGLSVVFQELMDTVKDKACTQIVEIMDIAFQTEPNLFLNFFHKNLNQLITRVLKDENYPVLMVSFLSCLSNVLLLQPVGFSSLCVDYCTTNSCSNDDLMERLLDVWLDKMDCMQLNERKRNAMALVSMLPHKTKFILDRFGLILDVCVNVLYTLRRTDGEDDDDDGSSAICDDCLVVDFAAEKDDNNSEEQYSEDPFKKEKRLMSLDPLYTVKLIDYIRDKLNESKAMYGEQLFNEAMETLDSTVAKQLMTLIK